MKDLNFNTTKFLINDLELFHNNINPKKLKRFAVGKACIEATDSMKKRIKERDQIVDKTFALDVNTEESAIRKNINAGFLTQQNLHSLICLFFHQFKPGDKFYQPYSATNMQNFLKSLELVHNEPGSVKSFRDFFGKLDIPDLYKSDFEIRIDEHWNFEVPINEEVIDVPAISPSEGIETIPENFKSKEKIAKSPKEKIISAYEFLMNLFKRNYLIIIGFLFSSFSYIVLPIASIGIYKTYYSGSERKVFKKEAFPYWGMLILNLFFSILSIIFLVKFVNHQPYENYQYSSIFDVPFNGNGFVTVHNLSKNGKVMDLGKENNVMANVNDTIIVSVTMSNISDEFVENIRFGLTPRISGSSNYHKFVGTLSGSDIYPVSDAAIVYSKFNTTLKQIRSPFLQFYGERELSFIDEVSSDLIFTKGYPIARLDKGLKNSITLCVLYRVENTFQNDEMGVFDNDPSGNGLGFFSINYCEKKCANQFKEITIPVLNDNEKFTFYTFVNYRNKGSINIHNAKVKLFFDDFSIDNELKITSELSGENVLPKYDWVKVKYSEKAKYMLSSPIGYLTNNHEENNPYKCKEYIRDEKIDVTKIRSQGITIGKLDTYMDGRCDEGYFIMEWNVVRASDD